MQTSILAIQAGYHTSYQPQHDIRVYPHKVRSLTLSRSTSLYSLPITDASIVIR